VFSDAILNTYFALYTQGFNASCIFRYKNIKTTILLSFSTAAAVVVVVVLLINYCSLLLALIISTSNNTRPLSLSLDGRSYHGKRRETFTSLFRVQFNATKPAQATKQRNPDGISYAYS
jgi:hypothetical protein